MRLRIELKEELYIWGIETKAIVPKSKNNHIMSLIEKFTYNGIEIRKTETGSGEFDFWKKDENGISHTLSEKQYNRLKSLNIISKNKIKEILELERGLSYYSKYNDDIAAEAVSYGNSTMFDGSETKQERIDEIYDDFYDLLETQKEIERDQFYM